MSRKCKADADKTYESLLDSAETVFSQGYAQTTFQEAAATAVKALLTGMIYEWLLDQADIDLAQVPQTVEMLIERFVDDTACAA